MHTIAVALQWTVLVAGFTVLVAAAVSSIRVRLSGAGFGTVVEHVERRWFGAGSVLLALLTGAAAMVVAGRLTGEASASTKPRSSSSRSRWWRPSRSADSPRGTLSGRRPA
ncbi:hypothetical protein ACW7N6_05325 [Streptomyces sp. UC1A3]